MATRTKDRANSKPKPEASPGAKPRAKARPQGRELESDKRLSESMLWDLQSTYYTEKGIDAWRGGDIPSLASTNAYVARVYAEAILNYLLDALALLDLAEPVYVVELGAGAGRLGFLVLKALERLQPHYPELESLRLTYVLTDVVEANVTFWEGHQPLQRFFEDGRLESALWSYHDGARVQLRRTARTLTPETVKNPVVTIANYVFDTLICDAFHVKDGVLYEARVSVSEKARRDDGPDPAKAAGVAALKIRFRDRPVEGSFYGDAELDAILGVYASHLRDASVLMPLGALHSVRALCELAGDRMLLLSSDKGEARLESFAGIWDWGFTGHSGCFSLMANLHAIGTFFEHRGGRAFHGPDPRDAFRFSAFAIGPDGLRHLARSLERPHEGFGVADVLGFTDPGKDEDPSFDRVLAIVRSCEHDPYIFGSYEPTLDAVFDKLDDDERRALRLAMRRVEELDYRLGDHLDVPFVLGRLYYRMDENVDALRCYQRSLEDTGEHEATYYNLALCYEVLDDLARAIPLFEKALAHKAGYLDAAKRLATCREKLAERSLPADALR